MKLLLLIPIICLTCLQAPLRKMKAGSRVPVKEAACSRNIDPLRPVLILSF